jgi:hypothetical protein
MNVSEELDSSKHWSLRLSNLLSVCWLVLIVSIVLAFIGGRVKSGGEFSGMLALIGVWVFFHGTLLWLALFVVTAIKRHGRVGTHLWLQTMSLACLEVLVGWGIAHQ